MKQRISINLLIICLLLITAGLTGCTWLNTKTVITKPDGVEYAVSQKRNSVVNFNDGTVQIDVDNRGNVSGFEYVLPMVLTAGKDIEINGD